MAINASAGTCPCRMRAGSVGLRDLSAGLLGAGLRSPEGSGGGALLTRGGGVPARESLLPLSPPSEANRTTGSRGAAGGGFGAGALAGGPTGGVTGASRGEVGAHARALAAETTECPHPKAPRGSVASGRREARSGRDGERGTKSSVR